LPTARDRGDMATMNMLIVDNHKVLREGVAALPRRA
jgi:hypothetical protein